MYFSMNKTFKKNFVIFSIRVEIDDEKMHEFDRIFDKSIYFNDKYYFFQ